MSTNGFPDVLQFARLSRGITDLRQRSETLRTELVTGRVADPVRSLGRQVGGANLLRAAIDENGRDQVLAQRALSRASIVQLALGQVNRVGADIGADLLGSISLSDEPGVRVNAERARGALNEAVSLFNQRFEGRALFAGDAVDGTALAGGDQIIADVDAIISAAPDADAARTALDDYFNDPNGGFFTSIYVGGDGNAPRAESENGALVDYTVRADAEPIRNLLRSYAEIAAAGTGPQSEDRDTILNEAASRLLTAGNAISELAAQIGVSEERLQNRVESLELEANAINAAFNDLTAVDQFEVASELQQIEAQLQASFVLTSRISSLSLVNFLQ